MDGFLLEVVLIAAAILCNGFFAASEIAVVSARPSRLEHLRRSGTRGAAAALRLKASPETFLATIQVAISLVGTLASALGGATAVDALMPWLLQLPLPAVETWARPLALGLVILAITYVSLVVGELTPKALGLRHPERISCAVARFVEGLSRSSGALVTVLTVSARALLRLLGQGAAHEPQAVSEDEVRHLLREGAARGIFERVEEQLVHNVFEFADTTVREIMVPRTNIQGLDVATPAEEVLARAVAIGHSRIPVYQGSIERPVGVLVLKDLLAAMAGGTALDLARLVHPPLFVPEVARISVLLGEFQRHRRSLALVVDEYGGVAGVVTLEDVLEEIVGEIHEERERAEGPAVTRLADGSYLLEGSAEVSDLRERLRLPVEERDEYHTLAGFIIGALDRIPRAGASLAVGGWRFTVVEMEGPRIVRVKAQPESR